MDSVKTIKGVKDIIYPESSLWQGIISSAEALFVSHGYRKLYLPVIEYTRLFTRSIGEDTDIVSKEMYSFSDRKGRSLSLRPEGTASAARAMIQSNMFQSNIKHKIFYTGPMFRYERPQAGRYRQFYQIGCELYSSSDVNSDVEIAELSVKIFMSCSSEVEGARLELNSVGCESCRSVYRKLLREYLDGREDSLCSDCRERKDKNTLRVLDCKNVNCQSVINEDSFPKLWDKLCSSCKDVFSEYIERLTSLIGDKIEVSHNWRMVRGLDYYTGPVFELKASDGLAVIAGGRYDKLIEELGGPPVASCGWALGLERLCSLSKGMELKKIPEIYSAYIDNGDRSTCSALSAALRERGLSVEEDYDDLPLAKKIKTADKKSVSLILIFGEEEKGNNTVSIKNLDIGEQSSISMDDISAAAENVIIELKNIRNAK